MSTVGELRSLAKEHVAVAAFTIPRLLRHRVWRDANPDEGAGLGVVLVPGFGAGDFSLTFATTWLRDRGYVPASAGVGFNVGCTSKLVDRVERRLEEHAEATGGPVVLLGQSRGGGLARLAAIRRPDLVSGLVMLGSPLLDPLGAHPHVLLAAKALARLSALGIPGLMDVECFEGDCYEVNVRAATAPLPDGLPAVSVYSKADGIVPWRLSLDPWAECVEVHSTHTGMGLDPDVYLALRPRLAEWAAARYDLRPTG
ncbi:Alpha/beta hydrolase family protein [Lentzea xinjiangensis]|uniref:Alpha/beta hydrolase family protein n=1 Tax=Lentzea xinjiangensis TaxID=402600 RepID=A0A1H9VJ21_9PSEU|nr:alpha/beta fold hydrolase [Lentzea xinjiangensis]SES21558.1 Alpha/beta hydrolase family protein [Lentzea xinjiangensis]